MAGQKKLVPRKVGGQKPEPRQFNEYVIERPGRIPALNYDHHHLWGLTAEKLEGLALQNPPVRIKVSDIIGIGNNRSEHYDRNWELLPIDRVAPALREKHAEIEAKLKFYQDRLGKINAPLAVKKGALDAKFENDTERALKLPGNEYIIVGGADRMHFVKRYKLDEINAHVIRLEDIVQELQVVAKLHAARAKKALEDASKA